MSEFESVLKGVILVTMPEFQCFGIKNTKMCVMSAPTLINPLSQSERGVPV